MAVGRVSRGGVQGLYVTAPAGSTIQVDIVTTSAYPLTATIVAPDGHGGLRVQTLQGTPARGLGTGVSVPNAYRYTFTTGAYRGGGYALLGFKIPRNAPLATVLTPLKVIEPTGCVTTLTGNGAPRFQVV